MKKTAVSVAIYIDNDGKWVAAGASDLDPKTIHEKWNLLDGWDSEACLWPTARYLVTLLVDTPDVQPWIDVLVDADGVIEFLTDNKNNLEYREESARRIRHYMSAPSSKREKDSLLELLDETLTAMMNEDSQQKS